MSDMLTQWHQQVVQTALDGLWLQRKREQEEQARAQERQRQAEESRRQAEEQARIAEQKRLESQTSLDQSTLKKEKASAINASYHANNSQEKSNLTSGLTGFAKLRRKILGSDDKLNIGKLGE